jgi:hypothetical protein
MLENKPVKNILFLLRKNDRTFGRRFSYDMARISSAICSFSHLGLLTFA